MPPSPDQQRGSCPLVGAKRVCRAVSSCRTLVHAPGRLAQHGSAPPQQPLLARACLLDALVHHACINFAMSFQTSWTTL